MHRIFALFACVILISDAVAQQSPSGWAGTAAFGPVVFPRYPGGKSLQAWPIPLLSINYNETVYVEVQRAGVYLLASDDKKIGLGLAVEPRFGFSQSDGSRLTGMTTRKTSIEGGPTFDWDFDVLAVSLASFGDLNHTSRGRSIRGAVYAPVVKDQHWDFGVLVSADRMNTRLGNYYFGVQANEVTPECAAFQPGAVTNYSIGFSGTYNLDTRHVLMFGVNETYLNRKLASSPLAESRQAGMLYVGYGWRL